MEQVRQHEGRQRVVEIGVRGGGGAEGAGCQDGGTVGQVDEAGLERDEFRAEELVGWGQGPEGGEAGEEDVGGRLQPGRG